MQEKQEISIRPAYQSEWRAAMDLAWKTFLKYEACDYSAEGVRSFYDFITDPLLERMFRIGEYQLFGSYEGKKMIGMVGMRNRNHISLLFVDPKYHKQGYGRALLTYLFHYCLTEMGVTEVTVNSSPYAVGFYHKMGFLDQDHELSADGIRYTPMKFIL